MKQLFYSAFGFFASLFQRPGKPKTIVTSDYWKRNEALTLVIIKDDVKQEYTFIVYMFLLKDSFLKHCTG